MRGADVMQASLFTYMTLDDFVPAEHPLRPIREIVNTALSAMEASFEAMKETTFWRERRAMT